MIIVADDLTGASDTGVQFVKKQQKTVVFLSVSSENFIFNDKVSVINTDCRSLPAEEAYSRTRELAKKLHTSPRPFIYKKIDSTLRGNVGQEIDGLMDEIPFDYCAVIPAYPANGRITVGGYHLVNGDLLEDSELAKDVKFPMTESCVSTLLAQQSSRRIGKVTIQTIRQGEIKKKVQELKSQGVEIIVFDSATNEDLKTMASFLEKEENVLWVGSAALAQALTENQVQVTQKKVVASSNQRITDKPTLTVAGSTSKVTREQVAYQHEQGAQLISVDPLHLLQNEGEVLDKHLEEAKKILGQGMDLIITTSLTKEIEQVLHAYKEKTKKSNLELGNSIASGIGSFASRLINEVEIAGVILTGGDIAYQTCIQLGINALEVIEEIEEGIPLSQVMEGTHSGMLVITKAGAFGHEKSLSKAMNAIKQRTVEE